MDFERPDQPGQIDDFENELRQVMGRRPAPPSLKRRIMQQRSERHTQQRHLRMVWLQRAAASILLVGVIAGGFSWREVQQRRKAEEVKQQVMTALRITNHALNDMNRRLAARNHADE